MKIVLMHAGINHISPYILNFKCELEKQGAEVEIIPELPLTQAENGAVLYFHRFKRFYSDEDSARKFIENIRLLKRKRWTIAYTVDNFCVLDTKNAELDKWVFEQFVEEVDLLFTHNRVMQSSLEKHWRVSAIYHGFGIINMEQYPLKKQASQCIISNKKMVFTYIGNIRSYKNIDWIVNIIHQYPKVLLIVAGPVHENVSIHFADWSNVVLINHFIAETEWNYLTKITDIFICPYNLESPGFSYGFFPSSLVQMAYRGKAIITPDCESTREILGDENALYYTDEIALNAIISDLIKSRNTHEDMAKKAHSYVMKNAGWDKMVQIIIDAIERVEK